MRLLTAPPGDGTTCGKLNTLVQTEPNSVLNTATMRVSYFSAGTHYYIVGVRASTTDSLSLGASIGPQALWVVNTRGKPKVVAKLGV